VDAAVSEVLQVRVRNPVEVIETPISRGRGFVRVWGSSLVKEREPRPRTRQIRRFLLVCARKSTGRVSG